MVTKRRFQGNIGENLAKSFLEKQGLVFVTENFSCRLGEIDLIFKDKEEVVFVEVKTRSSRFFGEGEEAVNYFKLRKILKAGQFFLLQKNLEEAPFRIDVVSILLDYKKKEATCKWIKNVGLE